MVAPVHNATGVIIMMPIFTFYSSLSSSAKYPTNAQVFAVGDPQ